MTSQLCEQVTSIQPTCEALRHSAVFGPFQSPLAGGSRGEADSGCSRCVEGLSAVMSLEVCDAFVLADSTLSAALYFVQASGKWPDDLEAISHLKAAFYLQIAKGLEAQHQVECNPSMECLHVLADGYVFELMISYPRQIELLRAAAREQDSPKLLELADVICISA